MPIPFEPSARAAAPTVAGGTDSLRQRARSALKKHFGYPGFRPGQEKLVLAALLGRDALGVLPTGGGKSVCYQVPALILPGLTLVVSPLISLMTDQVGRALEVGLRAEALTSALSPNQKANLLARARVGGLDLLLVAPERLLMSDFMDVLRSTRVALVAVDEAHCISEWGHDFRPAYRRFGPLCRTLGKPVMALTASATPDVRRDIQTVLDLHRPVVVVRSFDRPNLSWRLESARGHTQKLARLWHHLRSESEPAIVYAGTRRTVEAVRRSLAGKGLSVQAYHAGLEPEVRLRVQESFMSGETRVIVATNAFGMGIDKADVRRVLHYQLSGTLEGYYQEAGRAGRDGDPAQCIALHSAEDLRLHRQFVDRTRPRTKRLRRVSRVLRRVHHLTGSPVTVQELVSACPSGTGAEEVTACLSALHNAGDVEPDRRSSDQPAAWLPSGPSGSLQLGRCRRLRAAALRKIRAVGRYATTRGCRRQHILAYFGERGDGTCGRCDRCLRID